MSETLGRHLYVPASGTVSFDAMRVYADKIARQGEDVVLHVHSYGASCPSEESDEQCLHVTRMDAASASVDV